MPSKSPRQKHLTARSSSVSRPKTGKQTTANKRSPPSSEKRTVRKVKPVVPRKRSKALVPRSESQFRLLVESIQGYAVFMLDPEGRVVSWNLGAQRIKGYKPDEILGRYFSIFYPAVDIAAGSPERALRLAAERGTIEAEGWRVRKDGSSFLAGVVMTALYDQRGKLTGFSKIVRDITQEKEAEEALRQSEAFMASVLEHLPMVVFVKEANELRHVRFNKACEELLGCPREILMDKNAYDFFPKEQADFFTAKDREVLAGGRLIDIPEEPIQTKDKGVRIMHTKKVPIFDADGVPRYLLGLSEDITEHKRIEAAQREAEQRYRTLFELAPDSVVLIDQETTAIVEFNENACRQLGYTREEFLRLKVQDFEAVQTPQEIRRRADQLIETGSTEFETKHRTKDGRLLTVIVRARPVQFSDKRFFLAMFHDITERKQAEEAVQYSEMFFSSVLEHLPSMVFVKDANDLRFIRLNKAGEDLLGFARESLLGKNDHDFFPEEQADFFMAKDREVLAGGRLIDIPEEPVQTKDKGLRVLHTKKVPIFDADGVPRYLLGISEDITERKQAEEALRASEELFASAFRSSPDPMVLAELDSGLCLDVNEACRTGFGYGREDVVGRTGVEIGHWPKPEDRQQFVERLKETGSIRNFETRFRTSRGVWRDCLVSAELIDYHGRRCMITVAKDITDRKQAEEELRLAKFTVDRAVDGIYLVDRQARIMKANDAACTMLGYSHAELCTMTVHDIHPNFHADTWPSFWEETKQRGKAIFETVHQAKDGRLIPVEVTVNPLAYEGQEYHCAFVRNISERKQLEEQLRQSQKMEAVGRLAGGIAHDFNNILTVINGYCGMVLGNRETPECIRKSIEQVMQAGERAARLTQQLLAFSRQQVLRPEIMSLNAVVEKMEDLLQRLLGEDVQMTTTLDPDLRPILADRSQLEQVVMNLAVNARDAMPEGGCVMFDTHNVVLEQAFFAEQGEALPAGPYVSLTVLDTGSGIEEQTLPHIFDPFYTTKRVGQGTGLGLSTVQGIVRQSGGCIRVTSRVGSGTLFQLYFPALEPQTARSESSKPVKATQGAETILLVEDEPSVRMLVQAVLASQGFVVLEAGSAEEALAVSEAYQGTIDLLLSDIVLPKARGTKLVGQLLEQRPATKILLMSGYIDHPVAEDAEIVGRYPFMQKPFTNDTLLRKVRLVCDGDRVS
ncbi:MAG: PAS domain S-box protein [Nitrospira sp.]|nr:PAS domain S-box protein [Nitrospira sp.]